MEFTKITETVKPPHNKRLDVKLHNGEIHKDVVYDEEELEGRYLGDTRDFQESEVLEFKLHEND
jgi:hypothetical protein